MYFPYLRGRQYELLAIRELVEEELLSFRITPIIEPVKLSPTLIKTIEKFNDKNHLLGIVLNPEVGSFDNDITKNESLRKKYYNLIENPNIIKSFILNKNFKIKVENCNVNKSNLAVILNDKDYMKIFEDTFDAENPKYTFIPYEFTRNIKTNIVLFEDKFKKCVRNADYLNNDDEFFSDDFSFCYESGYKGFGDYSIIGKDYYESGFAPYAVAIHITYFDDKKNLRVHHFVSDSNEDKDNPGGKFYEALTKLNKWTEENGASLIKTKGLSLLLKHYKEGTYPGLGSAKKLSLMHHLELMGKYLDREEVDE